VGKIQGEKKQTSQGGPRKGKKKRFRILTVGNCRPRRKKNNNGVGRKEKIGSHSYGKEEAPWKTVKINK